MLAAMSLAVVALVTVGAVVLRAFGTNLPDAIGFSSMFMAVAVFWGAVIAFRHDDNIRVELVATVLGRRALGFVRLFADLVTVAVMALIAYAGTRQLLIAFNGGEVTPEMRLVVWPFVALAWLGLVLAVLMAASIVILRQLGRRAGQSQHQQEDGLLHGE